MIAKTRDIRENFLRHHSPDLDLKSNSNNSPHVVILGAGASLRACPNGDRDERKLPLMNNLVEIIGLDQILARYGIKYKRENFEFLYGELSSNNEYSKITREIEQAIEDYFRYLRLPNEITIYDYLVLSLRKKDIIATFNWDPFLSQAFVRNMEIVGVENMPQIVHLHGNVAIGICEKVKVSGLDKRH